MYLEKIDIKEFRKNIYFKYKKLFPKEERRSYYRLKKSYYNNITDIIQIISENKVIGFFIVNYLKNNPYLQLDYFAIWPENQNKGYGTEAVKLLKEMYIKYDGIFIEIEKIEEAKDAEEENTRQRRAKFYEKLGFCQMKFDLDLYGVLYSPYILPCQKESFNNAEVIERIFEIYSAILGENNVNKKCRIINLS
ncbi:MAG: GNAT family N-acetyltransferase [Clostridia bacterium]|nr:GNAT family N-acetyltransferase [Clostridia bacterium]